MQRKESSFKRAGPTESDYNQLLLEAREKCLPLMKRVVKKYPEYKKICISIEEKRPPVKWLKKLKAICRKIEDGISEKSNETQDKNGRKSRKDSNATLVKSRDGELNGDIQTNSGTITKTFSRWDVKPSTDIKEVKRNKILKKYFSNNGNDIKISASALGNTLPVENQMGVVDLPEDQHDENLINLQKDMKNQDIDVNIMASVASQNRHVNEISKSSILKKITLDNLAQNSDAVSFKCKTAVKIPTKSEIREKHNRMLRKGPERYAQTQLRNKESPFCEIYSLDDCNKTPLEQDKREINKAYNDEPTVEFTKENKLTTTSEPDNIHSNSKVELTDNDFQSELPFFMQNYNRKYDYSYSERPRISQTQFKEKLAPLPILDLFNISNNNPSSNQKAKDTQCGNVDNIHQAWSSYHRCSENALNYPREAFFHQPAITYVVRNNKYDFTSRQTPSEQNLISPQNIPAPSLTHCVPPNCTATLTNSTKPFCTVSGCPFLAPIKSKDMNPNKRMTTPLPKSLTNVTKESGHGNTKNSEKYKYHKMDYGLAQSPNNTMSTHTNVEIAMKKTYNLEGIPEENINQSWTFLSPDSYKRDLNLYPSDLKNTSYMPLKSVSLTINVPADRIDSKTYVDNRRPDSNKFSNVEKTCDVNVSERKAPIENTKVWASISKASEKTANVKQEKITQTTQSSYISPLSSLYVDIYPQSYTNVKITKSDSRKRKYDSRNIENIGGVEFTKKNMVRVKPMTKVCHFENEKYLKSGKKLCQVDISSVNNFVEKRDKMRNELSISDDFDCFMSHLENTAYPKRCNKRDSRIHSNPTSLSVSSISDSHCNNLPIDMVSQGGNSCKSNKLIEKDFRFKTIKEINTKPCNIRVKDSQAPKNAAVLVKQKDLLNCDKFEAQNIESTCSSLMLLSQSCENILQPLIERGSFESRPKANDQVGFSKSIDKKSKNSDFLMISQQPTEESLVLLKDKSGVRKTLSENEIPIPLNQLPSDQQINSKAEQINNMSSKQQNCLHTNGPLVNRPIHVPKRELHNKSMLQSSTERHVKNLTPITCKRNIKIMSKAQSPVKSVESKDAKKVVVNRCSLKRLINEGNRVKNIVNPQTIHPHMKQKCPENNLKLRKGDNANDNDYYHSSFTSDNLKTHDHKAEFSKKNGTSKKNNLSKGKHCKNQSSVGNKQLEEKLLPTIKSETKYCEEAKNNHTLLQKPSKDNMFTAEQNINTKAQETSKSKSTKDAIAYHIEECNANGCSEKSYLKDLVYRMRSLTQSEILEVISEFTSTLEESEYIQVSKERKPPSIKKEVPIPKEHIQSKGKTIHNHPKSFEGKTNFGKRKNMKCSLESKIVPSTSNSNIEKFNADANSGLGVNVVQRTLETKQKPLKTQVPNISTSADSKQVGFKSSSKGNRHNFSTILSSKPRVLDNDSNTLPKCKSNRKKKPTELDKIQADLETCYGLDNIMKCTGIRSCRLKNNIDYQLKEDLTERKKTKKRKITEAQDGLYYFLEDEITIKEEPIPDLPFDIKVVSSNL